VSQIESGKRQTPHPNILRKLAPAYGYELEQVMRMFGYLEPTKQESESDRIDRLFDQVRNDPLLAIGHRMRGELDLQTKRFIVEMYEKLKKGSGEA
jgi:transcriptional regulator with XRE-family HTH domain